MNKKAFSPIVMVWTFIGLAIAFGLFMFTLAGVYRVQTENSSSLYYNLTTNLTNSTLTTASNIMPTFFLIIAFIVFFILIIWILSFIVKQTH